MSFLRIFILSLFLFAHSVYAQTQLAASVDEMETAYKECIHTKSDSVACYRKFHQQMDSIVGVIFEKVKANASADEKSALIQSQISWAKKKGEYFKKLYETFVYNLQEGTWKKDMIRITYQQKAEFTLKRIKALLKQLKE